ncbi:unnamed protein product [Caenorhabditis angaria]|uniref:TAF6 C-terminal HEAT repeat domain-containing protein n=1 Tax=Caenorhabditis angaria TaxID=860376 RepID=A0A9P1IM48_9PELO|nr:unnamed protein product [Caenorhabditis angaria]
MTDESECVGKYIIHDGRLIRSQKSKIVPEKAKIKFLDILATTSVEKQYNCRQIDGKIEEAVQTVEKNTIEKGLVRNCPPITFGPALNILVKDPQHEHLSKLFTKDAVDSIGSSVRLVLRSLIEQSKKNAHHSNRKRIIPADLDLAFGMLKLKHNLTCPVMESTPYTERWYWGRKYTRAPPHANAANSTDFIASERFCDSLIIKDHWLCIEGIQPIVPENSIMEEVREKNYQTIVEAQKLPENVTKKDIMAEKRMTKQILSIEHQILYNELVNLLTNGTPLERQKALQCIEADTGLQFLSGRFVILFAEGIRVNIGTRNIRAISNLLKLAWSLMKNKHIRMERYLYVLIPSLISCVITKTIIPIQDQGKNTKNRSLSLEDEERLVRDLETEIRIREAACKLLFKLDEQYPILGLQMRIIVLIRRVFSGKFDPSAIYGALNMLFNFGYLTIKTTVIPRLHDIYCGLVAYCDPETIHEKMENSRKIVVETEIKRIELARNRLIELVMKILYEYESCEVKPRMADPKVFIESYAEFGVMFYSFIIETGKIDDDGRVIPSKSPILHQVGSTFQTDSKHLTPPPTKKSAPKPISTKNEIIDEEMLMMTDLLDDSHRKFAKIAKKLEEENEEEEKNRKIKLRDSFFGNSKLVLVRRNGNKIAYLRPLELAHIPSAPSIPSKSLPRSISTTTIRMSRSDESTVPQTGLDASEILFRRYLSRPSIQSAAIVYGRPLEMSENGKLKIDQKISEMARKLAQTRLKKFDK